MTWLSGFGCCSIINLAGEQENLEHSARACFVCVFIFPWDSHYQRPGIGNKAEEASSPPFLQTVTSLPREDTETPYLPSGRDSEGRNLYPQCFGCLEVLEAWQVLLAACNTTARYANSARGTSAFPGSPIR